MTHNTKILPTENPSWGFWGTATHNGYDTAMAWDASSKALQQIFKLKPEQTRDLLDARFGRHLADDLSFIAGGPTSTDKITAHIKERMTHRGWDRWVHKTLKEIRQAA